MVNGTIEGDPEEIESEGELEGKYAQVNTVGLCESANYGLQEAEQIPKKYRLVHVPFLNDARDEPCLLYTSPSPRDRG